MNVKSPIRGFSGPYHFLSNFWIETDATFVEFEYQRAKCATFEERQWFDSYRGVCCLNPAKAKAMGSKVTLREDWEDVKINIMLFYVTKKFKDHEDLRLLLEFTGDAHLEETNIWGDTYWGVCRGKGLNMLGEILMQVRSECNALQFVAKGRS